MMIAMPSYDQEGEAAGAIWTGVLPGHGRDGGQHLKRWRKKTGETKDGGKDYLIFQTLSDHSNFSLMSVDFYCRHQGKLKQWGI